MGNFTVIDLKAPYLIFIGEVDSLAYAKTGAGIVEWRRDLVAGQLRFEDNQLDFGVPDMTIEQAAAAGVKSLIIGVAPIGGAIDDRLLTIMEQAAEAGMDVVSGLHLRLRDFEGLKAAAEKSGASLIDVRVPSPHLPIGTGVKRPGRRLLAVGTDCSVGKKYSALTIAKDMQEKNMAATFRATGQTGIMIAGNGLPIDSVVADFITGAAEVVSPANDPDHWDVIEGQGSLFNASYSGVSLGLLHGSQPDAIVVCHDPTRDNICSCPDLKVPSVQECIDLNLRCGRLVNPNVICVGVTVNTSAMAEQEGQNYLTRLSEELSLPCVDPLKGGCGDIVDYIQQKFPS